MRRADCCELTIRVCLLVTANKEKPCLHLRQKMRRALGEFGNAETPQELPLLEISEQPLHFAVEVLRVAERVAALGNADVPDSSGP